MKLIAVVSLCLISFVVADACQTCSNPTEVEFRNKNTAIRLPITIEAFAPQGFKVTIPKLDGVDLFAFHAKINLPIRRREQGNLTWEVIRPTETNLVKVFPQPQLLIGDVINYWIRIQYNGVSLQSESQSHIVKELNPGPLPHSQIEETENESFEISNNYDRQPTNPPRRNGGHKRTTTIPPAPEPARPVVTPAECACDENAIKSVWAQMNHTVGKVRTLEENFTPLEEKLNSLTETVEELIKNMNIGTNLLLTGNLPVRSNPVEDVRYLLIEKLKLSDLSLNIVQADYQSNGIAFSVSSPIDKLRILKRSKDILARLSYQIVDADKPLFDVRNAK